VWATGPYRDRLRQGMVQEEIERVNVWTHELDQWRMDLVRHLVPREGMEFHDPRHFGAIHQGRLAPFCHDRRMNALALRLLLHRERGLIFLHTAAALRYQQRYRCLDEADCLPDR
jgi:hypothetical protein